MNRQPALYFSIPLFLFNVGALACSFSSPARAAPPAADEPAPLDLRIERLDSAPHELWAGAPERARPLWFAVQLGAAQLAGGERSFTGMLLAGISLERLAERRSPWVERAVLSEPGDPPRLKPPPNGKAPRPGLPPEPAPEPPAAPPLPEMALPALPLPVRITPGMARAAVEAALRRARLLDSEAQIDAIAARARASGLLPELRLRVSRLVDEAENLAPTEYDSARRTASGGTSLWLEARATWQLDRLVFADDELGLERIRRDRAEAQAKLVARVLELLFAWQRAVALEADPGRTQEEHRSATLEMLEAEASLDLLTDGWFVRQRELRP